MNETHESDVIVIGMGVGGETVASQLLDAGLSVVGIEPRLVGGECPYYACVPSKMALRAADLLAEARRIPGVAGSAEVTPDWSTVAKRIRDEATDDWDDTAAVERFTDAGGHFVRGRARFAGPGLVQVADARYRASRAVVIATGTDPMVPPIPGLDSVDFWTNREALRAKELPATLVVLGAGPVGVELSQAFARFGVDVTVVEMADRVLPREEPEASGVVAGALTADGVHVRAGVEADRVTRDGAETVVHLDDGTTVAADRLLVAVGRATDLGGLGVEEVGLDPQARFVDVDERLRAGDGLWAVGDITGRGLYTHLAVYQARIAAADIAGRPHAPADYRALPRVVFTDPEVGAVGLTEADARDDGLDVRVGTAEVPSTSRGWIHGPGNDGVIKLVVDASAGVLVGATSVGPRGGEVMAALALAVQTRTPVTTLREMIYAYPTFHRGIEDALRDL